MFEKFRIYIPSIGRADNQITVKFLLDKIPELASNITILTNSVELERYESEWGLDVNVDYVYDHLGGGIHKARQYALDEHLSYYEGVKPSCPYAIMIDDDMVFARREFGSLKLHECNREDLHAMFSMLEVWLDEGHPLVGVSARQGNNHYTEDSNIATRQMNFHAVNVQALSDLGVRFDELPVMEDFNVILSLLVRGLANKVSYGFCWNQKGSGSVGGCSGYRDAALQASCAERLAAKFPQYVTVVEKQSKTVWKGMESRKDVRIQWKKAYKDGLNNRL